MKKRPNATPSGPAGHSRQAFQGGTYSLMLTAAVLALLIVLNLLVSALPTSLTQYDISASKLYSVTTSQSRGSRTSVPWRQQRTSMKSF